MHLKDHILTIPTVVSFRERRAMSDNVSLFRNFMRHKNTTKHTHKTAKTANLGQEVRLSIIHSYLYTFIVAIRMREREREIKKKATVVNVTVKHIPTVFRSQQSYYQTKHREPRHLWLPIQINTKLSLSFFVFSGTYVRTIVFKV